MRRKIIRKKKIYDVDWIRNGFCYRTTTGCDWETVKECRETAKLIGEKIEATFSHYQTDVYC